jgi:hypothetical protein
LFILLTHKSDAVCANTRHVKRDGRILLAICLFLLAHKRNTIFHTFLQHICMKLNSLVLTVTDPFVDTSIRWTPYTERLTTCHSFYKQTNNTIANRQ